MLGGLDYHSLAAAVKRALGAGLGYTSKGQRIVATGQGTATVRSVGSNGQIEVADSTQSDGLIWTDFSKDPLNVNPNWLLDQINEGTAYTCNSAATQGPDGVTGWATGSGAFTIQKTTDPDNAALSCLKVSCTTADASIGATDAYRLYWGIEGYDCVSLMLGTASAQSITIQFKATSNSVTGTFGIAVQNNVANRRYIGTITIPDTNENSYSLTLTLDTSGTWQYGNLGGIFVYLTLAAGSNFQATAGSWGAGGEYTTSAQANFMSANTNVLYIKRFHVIPGNVVCAYKPADMQRELAKAQRYYEKVGGTSQSFFIDWNADAGSSATGNWTWNFRVEKRTTPTMSTSGAFTTSNTTGSLTQTASPQNCGHFINAAAAGRAYIYNNAGSYLVANARLS